VNYTPCFRGCSNILLGNGVNDDTAAIQRAIDAGGRCGAGCQSSTTTPAIIYFPAGTYLISTSIQIAYYTQIIGNANARPVLKASPGFSGGFGLMDGDVYGDYNSLRFGPTNIFFRTIRNMIFDMTSVPPSKDVTGLHWPTAQATSLQNCLFRMSSAQGTDHKGIFIESGRCRAKRISWLIWVRH
jgi:glucan 1,3-beta-glucosidase